MREQPQDPRKSAPNDRTDPSHGAGATVSFPRFPVQFGRYRIERLLGEGGMGAVYLALDEPLERLVALKFPFLSAGDDPEVLARFLREARAAAALPAHPNLCTVFDVGQLQGRHYLCMAYIEGRPLSDLIRTCQQLPLPAVVELTRKLALALHLIHQKGIIHRDLKPANVMVTPEGEPVVMDFGLARREAGPSHLSQVGALLGTPWYMSPEQIVADPSRIGRETDVYSLGVLLYEMLAGRVPFQAVYVDAVLSLIKNQAPPPPAQFRPGLPPALEAVCLKALAKEPAKRYPTMSAFAAALIEVARNLKYAQEVSLPLGPAAMGPAHTPAQKTNAPTPAGPPRTPAPGPAARTLAPAAAPVPPPSVPPPPPKPVAAPPASTPHSPPPVPTPATRRPRGGQTGAGKKVGGLAFRPTVTPPARPQRRRLVPVGVAGLVALGGSAVLIGAVVLAVLLFGNLFHTPPSSDPAGTGPQPVQAKNKDRRTIPPKEASVKKDAGEQDTGATGAAKHGNGTSAPPPAEVKALVWEADFGDAAKQSPFGDETHPWGKFERKDGAYSLEHYPVSRYGGKEFGLTSVADFTCEIDLRVFADRAGGCALTVHREVNGRSRALQIGLSSAGEAFVEPWLWEEAPKPPPLPRKKHAAIKPPGEFNKMRVTVRGNQLELLFNGVAVTPPLTFEGPFTPAELRLLAMNAHEKGLHAEIKSIRVWQFGGNDEDLLCRPPQKTQDWFVALTAAKKLHRWDKVREAADALADAGSADSQALWLRGLIYARQGQYDLARADLERVLAKYPNDLERLFVYAPLLLLARDGKGFEEVCQKLQALPVVPEDARRCYVCAHMLSLSPKATRDWDRPTKVIGHALKADSGPHHVNAAGMLLLRAGQYQQARDRFQKALAASWHSHVLNDLGLALAQYHLGNTGEAATRLAAAQFWLDRTAPKLADWGDTPLPIPAQEWLIAQALRREAEQLLKDVAPVPRKVLIYHKDCTDPKQQPFGSENSGGIQSGFRNGVFFFKESPGQGRWYGLLPAVPDFEFEAELRFLDSADSAWALSLHDGFHPKQGAVQVGINGKGEVFVQPWVYSPQSGKKLPWSRRLSHPAIKKVGEWNTFHLVVKNNTIQFLVNGVAVAPPVQFDGDLAPCALGFLSLRMHAEFKSLKVWSLKGTWEDMLARPPKSAADWRDYLAAAREKGQSDLALKAFQELDRAGGVSHYGLWVRGLCHVKTGQYDLARKDWQPWVDEAPADLDRNYLHATLLVLLDDVEAYRAVCRKLTPAPVPRKNGQGKDVKGSLAIPIPAGDEFRCHRLAALFAASAAATGDWDWPIRLIEDAVQHNPKAAHLLNTQGQVYLRAGKYQEARACFQKSLEDKGWPAHVLNRLGLAIAAHHLGDRGEAAKQLRQAQDWLDRTAPGLADYWQRPLPFHPQEWLMAHVLRREAELLLKN